MSTTTKPTSDVPCAPAGCSTAQPLPTAARDALRARFSSRRVEYIARVLTAGELAVIADPADALIIARIKRMGDHRLGAFERLEPASAADRRLFSELQCRWLHEEEYLLRTRLGRAPTHGELFADFMRNHNGLRFRAYFALKFPNRVKTKARKAG
jgi:hypothetical protein